MPERVGPNGQDFHREESQLVSQQVEERTITFERDNFVSFDVRGVNLNFSGYQGQLFYTLVGGFEIPVGTTDEQLEDYCYPEARAAEEIYGSSTAYNIKRLESTKGNVNSKLIRNGIRIDARLAPKSGAQNATERELYLHAVPSRQRSSSERHEDPADSGSLTDQSGVNDSERLPTGDFPDHTSDRSENKRRKEATSAFEGTGSMSMYDLETSDFIDRVSRTMTNQGIPLSQLENLIERQGITTRLSRLNAVRKWTGLLQRAGITVFDDKKCS